jgi:hypothetical protein
MLLHLPYETLQCGRSPYNYSSDVNVPALRDAPMWPLPLQFLVRYYCTCLTRLSNVAAAPTIVAVAPGYTETTADAADITVLDWMNALVLGSQ